MRYGTVCFALLADLALLAGVVAQATAGITVDGNWSDWGLSTYSGLHGTHLDYSAYGTSYPHLPDGGVSSPPPAMISPDLWVCYDIEDTKDSAGDSSPIGPLYDGQNYDAEFLGVAMDDTYLYIAIFTGQRPDNGIKRFAPGDIRVQAGDNVYGIEVGGGPGDDSNHDGMISKGDDGTFYNIEANGYTNISDYGDALTPDQVAGSVWLTADTDWEHGISGSDGVPMQLKELGGTADGNAEKYFCNYSSSLDEHAFIELSVPLTLFGGEDVDLVSWGPACGNDYSYLEVCVRPAPPIPEPASFGIWALLVVSAGGCRWWRCSRRRKRGTS
jgi:hypothetical protein